MKVLCISANAYYLHWLFSSTFLLDYRNRCCQCWKIFIFCWEWRMVSVLSVSERVKMSGFYLKYLLQVRDFLALPTNWQFDGKNCIATARICIRALHRREVQLGRRCDKLIHRHRFRESRSATVFKYSSLINTSRRWRILALCESRLDGE